MSAGAHCLYTPHIRFPRPYLDNQISKELISVKRTEDVLSSEGLEAEQEITRNYQLPKVLEFKFYKGHHVLR